MKTKIRTMSLLMALVLTLSYVLSGCFLFEDETLYIEDNTDYGPYDNSSTYTMMIYLCGSDLETWWGCATTDLLEMIEGYNGNDSVNVIVQTGGSYLWHNAVVDSSKCQRYRVTKNTVALVDDTVGDKPMSSANTLTDFIKYASKQYPADRYGLVLWNHGGGSAGGYGYDERSSEDMMSLKDFGSALENAELKYDFVGFDACLMGGFETCLAVAPYTKYLIASQESEPGCGWYYTDFLRMLSEKPSTDTVELGKKIIDTYIEKAYESDPSTYSTLGMFDTEKVVSLLLPAVNNMSNDYSKKLDEGSYSDISKQRSDLREMASAEDYVDLYSLAESNKDETLQNALKESTVYFAATENGTGDNGLSIYYPYNDLSSVDEINDVYESVDYDVNFDDFIDLFVNIMAEGQIALDSDINDSDFSIFDWFDSSDTYEDDYYSEYDEDYGALKIVEKGDNYILELTDSDWDNISSITLNCLAVYDDCYVDFGKDDYYELDSDNNLIVGYDCKWVALNGNIVPFYFEERYENGDDFLTYGYVPCKYNDKDAQLLIAWDSENPDGYVSGVRLVYENDRIGSRGSTQLKDGDIIEPYFDVYNEDLEYVDKMTVDEWKITVKGDLTVSYEDVYDQLGDTYIYYEINDLFNNSYVTESVIYNE